MVLALGRLTARVQSNIGIIRGGVAQGLSSTAIQGLIRSTGQAGLRRTDLLAGIRHVQGIAESGSRIRNVGLDRFPDPARIAPARGPMISNFSYDVRVRGTDFVTGEKIDRFITVRSGRNLTPRQIQQEAQEALDAGPEGAERYGIDEVESFTIIGARRK